MRAPTTAAAAAAANARYAAMSPDRLPSESMTITAQGDPPPTLPLGPLLGNLPAHLLQAEVLRRLGPADLASLAGAGRGCAAAVAATALMQWANRAKTTSRAPRVQPATAVFEGGLCICCSRREPGGVGVAAQHRLPVEFCDGVCGRWRRTPGDGGVAAQAWLPVG